MATCLWWHARRARSIVAVVGFGHLRGITYHLLQGDPKLSAEDLAELVRLDPEDPEESEDTNGDLFSKALAWLDSMSKA